MERQGVGERVTPKREMNGLRKYTRWFAVSLIDFVVSIFLHECGHGLASILDNYLRINWPAR